MTTEVLAKVPFTDYTLLVRDSSFQPYILAYCYDEESKTWTQGHYFSTFYGIEAYLNEYADKGYCHGYGDADFVEYQVWNDSIDAYDGITGELLQSYQYGYEVDEYEPEISAEDYKEWCNASCGIC